MIAIIDYDAGNIMSVTKAFEYLGEKPVLTRDKETLLKADKVILPGVGSFGVAMDNLNKYDLVPVIREIYESGKPLLGICLGLQLLFEGSEESFGVPGLGFLPGVIRHFPESDMKIPHMGWNSLKLSGDGRLFKGLSDEEYVYFVHTYYLDSANRDIVKATSDYILEFDASIEKGNLFACQFHPEKSGRTGLKILKNFIDL
ncbi:MAG: imidazole glycerol phosphate synthase subunit HisH [Clostridiales bacterium]|nr:imidazole glycerol phosphate synthase subunit HisH [Clostridiales bacterium]